MKNKRQVILTDDGCLKTTWPFTRERFEQRLKEIATVQHVDLNKTSLTDLDWKGIDAIALFGGELTEAIIAQSDRLKVVGGMTDGQGPSSFHLLSEKNIPFIDATAAWGQSVAECGFGLILCALRKLPHWHKRLADGAFDWTYPYEQFCDDPNFINGDLGTKTIGIVGLGQIGSRMATWCHQFGATVLAYDPYASDERFEKTGATKQDLDTLINNTQILVIAVPPTPSAQNLVDARLVRNLSKGSIVITITRTAAINVNALRNRVLANEIFWAADVYDIEPLPANDPILGRNNVVHIPHIAGRTKDANIRLADMLADDFIRVFQRETPAFALTPKTVSIRTGQD